METKIKIEGYDTLVHASDFSHSPEEYLTDCCHALIEAIPEALEMGNRVQGIGQPQVKISIETTIKVEPVIPE